MEITLLLLGLLFLNVVFYTGQLIFAFRWGMHHKHYFIGFGPKLFTLEIKNTYFTTGIYIPVFGLAKIYEYESGIKKRAFNPWEFMEQPLWKRFIVGIGGTLSLMLAGILIFISLAHIEKETYISKDEVNKHGIFPSGLATEAGFEPGDKVILINGKEYKRYSELLYPKEGTTYTIERDGKKQELMISDEIAVKFPEEDYHPFLSVYAPFKVRSIMENSTAEQIGLKEGDRIKRVNSYHIVNIQEFKKAIEEDEDGEIDLVVQREDTTEEILLQEVPLNEQGVLGFTPEELTLYSQHQNSLSEAVTKGITRSYKMIASNITGFIRLFSGEVLTTSKSVSGPIRISEIYGNQIRWRRFWAVTGMLAVIGSFMSLFPFPNTSFWNIYPLIYEASTKKAFQYESYRKIKRFGFYLVIALMIYVLAGDLIMLFG